eukprot:jgi/Astpho2/177/Aster-x0900
MQAYEDQSAQCRAVQQQLQLCEDELAQRSQDLERCQADASALQARVGELEDSLQLSRDDGSAQVTALELRCREQDRLLERQREELELQGDQLASAERMLKERATALSDQGARLSQAEQEREDSDRLVKELMQQTKKLQEERSMGDDHLRSTKQNVEQLQRKLQQAQESAEAEAQQRLAIDKDWNKRHQKAEKEWSKRMEAAERAWSSRLEDSEAHAQQQRTAAEQLFRQQAAEVEVAWRTKVDEAEKAAAKRLDAANWKAASEKALLEKQWQARLVEREQQWTQARAAAEQQWQASKAAAEQQWQQQLAAVQESHRQELVGSESAAGAARGQLEARVGAITERLLHMARHEAKRERRRGELVKAVEELRRVGHSEIVRCQELEAALRESAAIFKRELYEKNEELVALQAELGQLREWQGQALEAMSQDLQSRQGSPPPGDASPAPFSKSQHPLRLRTTPARPAVRLTSHFDATKHSTAAGRTLHHREATLAAAAQLDAESPIAAYAGGGSRRWDTEAAQQGSPFGGDGSGVPAELERELHALRTARLEYEHATAAQEELRNSLLSRIAWQLEHQDKEQQSPPAVSTGDFSSVKAKMQPHLHSDYT